MPRGNSQYTREQRDAFAKRAGKIGAIAVAKKAGVHVQTIQNWRTELRKRQRTEASEWASLKKAAEPVEPPTSGASNGHATSVATPPDPAGLDKLDAQLRDALVTLDRVRAAYRSVFGGS